MVIDFHCESCRGLMRVGEQLVGKRVRCPHCAFAQAVRLPEAVPVSPVSTDPDDPLPWLRGFPGALVIGVVTAVGFALMILLIYAAAALLHGSERVRWYKFREEILLLPIVFLVVSPLAAPFLL